MDKDQYYRFQVFATQSLKPGGETRRSMGAAFLREGQKVYTLKLWMFPESKFYLMADQDDPTKMAIMTRELKRNPKVGKGKFFWNLIGNGFVDVQREVVRLEFDLLNRPVYMSIFPMKSSEASSDHLAEVLDAS